MLPEQLRLTDGTIVRRCPTDKPLYCSRAGKFYSVHNRFRNNRSSESEIRTGASKPCGEYLTDDGWVLHQLQPSFSPVRRKRWRSSNGISGTQYPVMRHFDCMNCHTLMALTWIGPRPTFTNKNGKTYVGICHHLIPDRLDYKPANLLCWLTRAEHAKADRRQRTLRKIVPDLHDLSYEKHRRLQDSRITSDEVFDRYVQLLKNVF